MTAHSDPETQRDEERESVSSQAVPTVSRQAKGLAPGLELPSSSRDTAAKRARAGRGPIFAN